MAPFHGVKDGKSTGGISTDIMVNILKEAKIPYRVRIYPAPRLYLNLATGKTDVFIGIKNVPSYKDKVIFSKKAVSEAALGVYTLQKKLILKKEDLIGKSVIVVRGYRYGGLLHFMKNPKNHVQLEVATTHENGLRMLKRKRAHYFLDYTNTVDIHLLDVPIPNIKYTVIDRVPLFLIVSKSTPNAESIMKGLELAWQRIYSRPTK